MNHDRTKTYSPDSDSAQATVQLPEAVGRYRVRDVLGKGAFGIVYLARDEQLQRLVAIKVPHSHLIARDADAAAYLTEARTVASLDHPNIVPVHDVGSSADCPCFIVSKYIQGTTLTKTLATDPPSVAAATELVATVAETLHYAHQKGLVHRDIKPSNILLDSAGKPYLTDFGLAMWEENIGRGPKFAGTPSYMSPEQARFEGHRVDGRSDIFSLGVVYYELLTGIRPFRAETESELLEQITSFDARPPRQIDDRIPRELERICLKALSKRATERYTTAKDMAADLRSFLEQTAGVDRLSIRPRRPADVNAAFGQTAALDRIGTPISDRGAVRVVPKGLRSFDAHDADFFLDLLPGPRDRDGLPDSIRFWKARIEETDPDSTFSVGLVYGPSGCGKSSLFKAGVLPRLSPHVTPVYVEAAGRETETRLLGALRKRGLAPEDGIGLTEALASLRRGVGLPAGKKVLIVLDQFEQWLHARKHESNSDLVQALRHCDGRRVQCVVMVRDDFWLAVSRFMRDLEIDLVPGQNIALVDLFDLDHARRVLASFGRAYGKLPESSHEWTAEQREFLRQAVAGLAQEDKVICVRLALFADMIKGRPWTSAALKEVGGPEGIRVAFLEETFSSPAANPKHRLHERAARAVLQALLPESGTDIKGNIRSEADLLAASGYADRLKEFEELIRVLDGDVRLITPTDPEAAERGGSSGTHAGQKYYQLTHDYMVPSLRDWLTRKQKETRQGRAELDLAERAALWTGKPEARNLPSPWEWASVRLFTRRAGWTPSQRRMMRVADSRYLTRAMVVFLVLVLVGWGVREYTGRTRAHALREQLLRADVTEVPTILDDMRPHRRRVDPLLQESLAAETDEKKKLLLSLALVESDRRQLGYLTERLLQAAPQDFAVIRQVLAPYKDDIVAGLWTEFNGTRDDDRRFRAACALVDYASTDDRWTECATVVVDGLIAENPLALSHWKDALNTRNPVRGRLLPALAISLQDRKWGPADRRAIIEFYRVFSQGEPEAMEPLERQLAVELSPLSNIERAKRKATVAAALAALGKTDSVWPLLKHSTAPTLRSFLIERLGTSGVDPRLLVKRLTEESDTSARRALILALGGFPPERVPGLDETDLLRLYEHDVDSGIHGSASWVLRRWGQRADLDQIDERLATSQVEKDRQWFINKQRQSFAVLTGPGFLAHRKNDSQSAMHRFAIALTELRVRDYREFKGDFKPAASAGSDPDSPANNLSWNQAAEYCNWLSKRDGLDDDQLCFFRKKDGTWEFFPDYLQRRGYRLANEREWEFACRAGAETQWHFGEADHELTGYYAWWRGNASKQGFERCFPVASLKPNDSGLFDMHGNLAELCQEGLVPRKDIVSSDIMTPCRGGPYLSTYQALRVDAQFPVFRRSRNESTGIRLVRTMP